MACDCTTEISDAVTLIDDHSDSNTALLMGAESKDLSDVYDWTRTQAIWTANYLQGSGSWDLTTIADGINNLISWDNDKGPIIDAIPGQFSTLTTFVGAETTALSNQLTLMQSNLNESIEITEDNTVTIINTSIPGAITSIESSIKGAGPRDNTQVYDWVRTQAVWLADYIQGSGSADLTTITAQLDSLTSMVSGLVASSTVRDWTTNP